MSSESPQTKRTHRARTSDGVSIEFDDQGAGLPLLLVHGLGDSRELWSALVARWCTRFRCVALDLRGHGASETAADYDPFALHRDLHAVVRELGLDQPLLIGHSLGGFAVSTYAARYPARGVINVDQPLELSALASSVRELAAQLRSGPADAVLFQVLASIGLGALEPDVVEQLRRTRRRLPAEVVPGVWKPLLENDTASIDRLVTAAISGTTAPYLALHGAQTPPGYASWLRARIAHARIETWSGAGHFPHLVDPERFTALVSTFAQVI